MSTPFAELRFNDPGRAFAALEALLQEVPSDLAQHLAYALEESAEPDLVLTRLERYLGSSLSRASELDRMAQAPFYARLLARIFDQSSFLTDIVCRNPEYVTWLWDEVDLNVTPPKEVLALELAHLIAAFDTFADHCKALRRFKRREFLRIAVRDVFAHCDLADVVEDLSNLADVTLEAACESAHRALIKRYGAAHGTIEGGLAIIAMGKLGGRELNFSSDIDLMFLHTGDAAGEHPLGRSRAEYFQKAGELIIKAISENSADGHVFRVDMRLRPHGNRGPLATAEQTALVYYEQVGQAWERQALLKARAVAGDLVLGERFIERTRPFVFPRYFDDSILEDIREVKQQMEALVEQRGETETEVKLGRGGIRDIEFTIQVLQLLNGGRFEELRTTNTLEAIEALGLRHLLRPLDAATLSSNYVFLRQVEHRLQIENSQQVHALPKKAEALETFARRMGYASAASFMSEYRDRTEANRTILDQFLATEGAGFRWVKDLLNAHSAAESSLPKLEELGFQELERARRELLLLCNGTVGRPHALHVRQAFTAIAPTLLQAFANCPSPDTALMRLGQLFARFQAPAGIYDMLKWNPKLGHYIALLVSNSEYLTELMIRDPGLLETFGVHGALDRPSTREDLDELLVSLARAAVPGAAPFRLRDGETLRVGMRELFAGATVFDVGRELTLLADVLTCHAFDMAREKVQARFGPAEGGFAVLGLGKMGGCEMGYGSDLDLAFVYSPDARPGNGMAPSEYYAAWAANIIHILKEQTKHGRLYDVDVRLRPYGNQGILAVNLDALRDYHDASAHPSERLALVKTRAVAGTGHFAGEAEKAVRELAFAKELTAEDVAAIDEVREKNQVGGDVLDVKKNEGGLFEIEFLVRLLQLEYAAAVPELKRGDVAGALDVLAERELLTEAETATLRDAYILYRRVENRVRMLQGRSGSALPESEEDRKELAGRLGIEGDLKELITGCGAAVHRIYRQKLDDLTRKA